MGGIRAFGPLFFWVERPAYISKPYGAWKETLTNEAKFTATIKLGPGYEAPWLVVRSNDAAEHELDLQTVERNGTFATLGRVAAGAAAQYNLGKGLGAQTIAAPVSTPEPQYAGGTQAPQQQYQAPAPVAAYQPPAAAAPAGAPAGVPLILGIPAKWIDKGSWKAWADPRGQHETGPDKLKTDDENHPGLAQGTHKFWRFVR
jgi:hypothetical protein